MRRWTWALMVVLVLAFRGPAHAAPAEPVVRAVLFWAESCPHCHEVIDNVLPPLQAQYGQQLDIQMIEISSAENYAYFDQIEDQFGVPADMRGVPALLVGERLLIGAVDIAAQLPGLVAQHLAAGGLGYPELTGLEKSLSPDAGDEAMCTTGGVCAESEVRAEPEGELLASTGLPESANNSQLAESEFVQVPGNDGFTIAIVILIGMGLALAFALIAAARADRINISPAALRWSELLIPILSLAGLGVAGYLAYVETQNVAAICGPVGDCNAVQASPYAKLFGILPVGLLGAAGYVGILLAWLAGRNGNRRVAELAPLALFGMALFGVLFSMYLTYLEPFVIRAVCAWCLSQAVIITLVMLLALNPVLKTLQGE